MDGPPPPPPTPDTNPDPTPGPTPRPRPPEREQLTSPEINAVLSRYELGKVSAIHEVRAGDPGAPKALIECARGSLLLKRRSRACDDPYLVAFQHSLQLRLEAQGYPVAPLLGTRDDNNSMVQLDGRVYELFRYINAAPADGSVQGAEIAGGALARLHHLSQGHSSAWTAPEDRSSALERVRRRMDRLASAHASLESACARLTALSAWAHHALLRLGLDRSPTRVIHGDWHPGNTLFREGRLVGVIDFDAARMGELACDLAQGLVQFSLVGGGDDPDRWPDTPGVDRLLALWRGYVNAGDPNTIDERTPEAMPLLMVETLVKEAAAGVGADGHAGRRPGLAFLAAIARKGEWLESNAESLTQKLSEA